MGFSKKSLFGLLLLVFSVSTAFGGGFSYDGLGVKARGMGGAFRAVADDWSAAHYNPAGYFQIADNMLAMNLDVFHNRYSTVPNVTWDGYSTGFYNDKELYNKHAILNVPQGGILFRLPVWGETVFGFSIMQTFDQNQSWQLYSNNPAHNDRDYPTNQFYNNLDVVNFQFSAARGFMEDNLMVGIGLSLLRGDMIYNDVVLRDNPFIDDPDFGYIADRPSEKIPEWYNNDGSGWGFGYKIGLLYNINEKMKFGLVYNGKSSIDISGETDFRFYMADNPTLGSTLEGHGIQRTDEEYYFVSGTMEEVTADFETTLDLPGSFGAGISYQVNEKLLVALDAEYVMWSQFEGFQFAYSNYQGLPTSSFARAISLIQTDMAVPIEWDNAGRVMLGADYQYRDYMDIRAGFGIDQTVVTDDTFIPQFMDLATKYSYNVGAGFDIGFWRLEIAGTYIHQGDVSIGGISDVDGDGLMDNIAGDYSADNYHTMLGISYRF